jgi:hypothetical protein
LEKLAEATGLSRGQVGRVARLRLPDYELPKLDDEHFVENMSILRSLTGTHRSVIPMSDLRKWTTIGYMMGWEKAADKLSSEASTMALVSTLTLSLLFPVFVSDWPEFHEVRDPTVGVDVEALENIFGLCVWFAIVCSMGSVVFAVILINQVNLCCSDQDFTTLIRSWEWVEGIAFCGFVAAMVFMDCAAWAILVLKCNYYVVVIGSTFQGVVLVWLFATFGIAHMGHRLSTLQQYNSRLNFVHEELVKVGY